MRSVPRGLHRHGGAPSIRDRVRDPLPPLHVVDVEPGVTEGTALCGRPGVKVIDEHWERGLGGCSQCRAEGRKRAADDA
jgi:hypothetical protein